MSHSGKTGLTGGVAPVWWRVNCSSKHLALPLEQGLVSRRRDGLFTRYRIADPTLERLCRLVCGSLAERHETVRSHLAS